MHFHYGLLLCRQVPVSVWAEILYNNGQIQWMLYPLSYMTGGAIMIKIVAKMPVKDGEVENFKATAKELVEKSAAEAGNISYSLNVSTTNPSLFAIIEFWKDQAAIDFHNNTAHFTGILPKLAALCDGEISIELFNQVDL
jgi:quinol monooxygenase YgiN